MNGAEKMVETFSLFRQRTHPGRTDPTGVDGNREEIFSLKEERIGEGRPI
jgi:hypothetical protein